MQTLTIDIQENFLQDFLIFIGRYKDKNLEFNPYFYERKKDLEQIIEDSENGKMKLLSQEESDNEIKLFFENLKKNKPKTSKI
jgi:hypothetical protein